MSSKSINAKPRPAPISTQSAICEPMLWLTGGALVIAILMIVGLIVFISINGLTTFWPTSIETITTHDKLQFMGEVFRAETSVARVADIPADWSSDAQDRAKSILKKRPLRRFLLRCGNRGYKQGGFQWLDETLIQSRTQDPDAVLIETREKGRLLGNLASGTGSAKDKVQQINAKLPAYHARHQEVTRLKQADLSVVSRQKDQARLDLKLVEMRNSPESDVVTNSRATYETLSKKFDEQSNAILASIAQLEQTNHAEKLTVKTVAGEMIEIGLGEVVRMYSPNDLTNAEKWGIYWDRWYEFLTDWPREANMEGGIFPAIWGTITMTIAMSLFVVPLGVLAALYLREYAKPGPLTSAVRIAINNLAGVPSIVFGIFGLGFFCYMIGGRIDDLFYPAHVAEGQPVFGSRAFIWASLTLALLTVPVVIVATEEAIASVPKSMREGSYACGASHWQTISRIVLPQALPGVMTGMVLAMARGAGEVAPLMLVGVLKSAENLPIDSQFPYVHLDRSFMHLGFHIYDLGFQSPDSEAARPTLFSTTLVLLGTVITLNLLAIVVRARLRKRYVSNQF